MWNAPERSAQPDWRCNRFSAGRCRARFAMMPSTWNWPTSFSVGLAFVIALLATRKLARAGGWLQILDHPNRRSLHSHPIPRTGGLGILLAVYSGAALFYMFPGTEPIILWILLALAPVALVSFLDDRNGVKPVVRLLVHLVAAVIMLFAGLGVGGEILPAIPLPQFTALSAVATVLFTVWMINLYNFMDGIDGFAGGMAVWGFGALGIIAWQNAGYDIAVVCWIIAAACAGFLIWNWPPARIFLGDSGSSSLGTLVSGVALWGAETRTFPIWIPVLVFSPFVADASVTLIRRAARRERLWVAHRDHYYQRIAKRHGHRFTTMLGYVLMFGCAASGIAAAALSDGSQWMLIMTWVVIYALLARLVDQRAPVAAEGKS